MVQRIVLYIGGLSDVSSKLAAGQELLPSLPHRTTSSLSRQAEAVLIMNRVALFHGLLIASIATYCVKAFSNDLCAQYGDMVPIPGLNGQDFCETAGITEQALEKCILLDFAGKAFTQGLGNSIGVLACRAAGQMPSPTHTISGQIISLTLPDRRPIRNSFDSSVLSAEGATYHFWWTEVFNFGIAASCAAGQVPHTVTTGPMQLADPARSWQVTPSWQVHSVLWSSSDSQNKSPEDLKLYLPLAAINYNSDTMAVIIRGTETYSDWETDFTYSQASFAGPVSWPGRTHEGFSRLAAYLWSTGVQAAVDSLVLQQGSSIQHVVVAGHSMGAGVGTLLSYTIQTYLEKHRSVVRVDAMLFAPPNVGDGSFAQAYGAVVNARRIPFQSDIVAQLPCSPTVTACVRAPWLGAPMIALGVWTYAPVPGTIALTAAGMPMESESWSNLKTMYACQLGRYVLATHVCAYQCYFSQYVAGGLLNNMCRLWQPEAGPESGLNGAQAAPQGSYCYGYPVAAGRQYPYESASGLLSLLT